MSKIQWVPLESNPDCLRDLGVSELWGISDVISLDEEMLDMVRRPCLAILLLFPITPKYTEYFEKQEKNRAEIQEVVDDVYFMKQTVKNACGTVALIHAIANNESTLDFLPGSAVKKFLESTKKLDPEERGRALEQNMDISVAHETSAVEGQTEAPSADEDVYLHYVAIVHANGKLVELDGRKDGPVVHGDTSKEGFVKDAFKLCREFMDREPENHNFTVLSFGNV